MSFVPVNLAYAVYEPTSSSDEKLSPIIFLHGAGDSKEIWGIIPKTIADKTKRRVYAIDARNHGDSEWTEIFNFDVNVDDLMHFMEKHSIEKSVLVGHSMGGITSIRAALRFPRRIESIFVEDIPVNKLHQKTYDSALKYFKLCEEASEHIPVDCDISEVHKHIADYLFEKGSKMKKVGSRDSLDKIFFALKRTDDGKHVWKTNWKVIREAMSNGETLLSAPQGVYNGPAHFIYGSLSPFKIGEKEEDIRQYFPNAEFFRVEGADHYIHPHHPEQFTETIVECLLKKREHSTNLMTNL